MVKTNKIRKLILIHLYTMLAVLVIVLGIWIYQESQSRKKMENMQQMMQAAEEQPPQTVYSESSVTETYPIYETTKEREILPQFEELHLKNADMVGWLSIPGTEIDYPVMYREDDNDYYLSHNFDKEKDRNGLLVLDKRCDPDEEVTHHYLIHGHNMHTGAMFGTLKYYEQQDYYKKHPTITYCSLYEENTYEIIAVFKSSVYNEETTDFQYYNYIQIDNEEQFQSYVTGVKDQSLYDTGVEAFWGDCLITLSTCEYSKENGRLVIVGRAIR